MQKIQIGIGIGHGGTQPGASGVLAGKSYTERGLVRKIMPPLIDLLNNSGKFDAATLNKLCGKDDNATWPPIQQRKEVAKMLESRDLDAIIVYHFNSSTSVSARGWVVCYNSNRSNDYEFAQKYYDAALQEGGLLIPKIGVAGNRAERLQPRTDLAMLKIEDIVKNLQETKIPSVDIPKVAKAVMDSLNFQLRSGSKASLAGSFFQEMDPQNRTFYYAEAAPIVKKIERAAMFSAGAAKPEMNIILVEMGFLSNQGDLKAAVERPLDLAAINFAAIEKCFF
jgi:N-acetylmuramoyl-L-alanine amidase